MREERRLFENRVLRRIFGSKMCRLTREWEKYIMKCLMNYIVPPIFFGR